MKSLYVISSNTNSNTTEVCMSLIDLLQKQGKNIAFFKPIIADKSIKNVGIEQILSYFNLKQEYESTYALSLDEFKNLIAVGKKAYILELLLNKFKTLEEKYDFIVCQGLDNLEFDFAFEENMIWAKDFNSALINVINSENKNLDIIQQEIQIANYNIKSKSCEYLATFLTYANDEIYNNIKSNDIFSIKKTTNKNISLMLDNFNSSIDTNLFMERIKNKEVFLQTPALFEYGLLKKAKVNKKTIVLPEGNEDRILKACEILLKKDAVNIILLGDEEEISKKAKILNLNLYKAKIINPKNSNLKEKYAQIFYELRKTKGVSLENAKEIILDKSYFATMMVYCGEADGLVSGAITTTADTIRPALQVVKTKPEFSIVSSVFFMCLDTNVLLYADCAVNPNPTAEQLAQIAISTAKTAKDFGIEPKVAMLSYATGSSAKGEEVEKIQEAVKIAQNLKADFILEGPIQYDAATNSTVAKTKLPESKLKGEANVLIFPNLSAGNIAYKAVQRSTNAIAIGPVLQGLKKPINDLSRGCLVEDIVNTVLITAIQAQGE